VIFAFDFYRNPTRLILGTTNVQSKISGEMTTPLLTWVKN